MITEPRQMLMDDQAITDDAASEHRIDLGAPRHIIDGGYWVVQVGTAFTDCTSIQLDIKTHEDESFSTGTRIIGSTGVVLLAALTANAVIGIIPAHKQSERYVEAYVTVNGSNAGAGTLSVYYVKEYPFNKAIPNA